MADIPTLLQLAQLVLFVVERYQDSVKKLLSKSQDLSNDSRKKMIFSKHTNLVGRTSEIEVLQKAIEEEILTRVLYLYGSGGIGKTRLLEEIQRLISLLTNKGNEIVWTGIIDLYHSEFHRTRVLLLEMANRLDPDRVHFSHFFESYQRFEKQQSAGMSGTVLERQRIALIDDFQNEFNRLSEKTRVILTFDTVEKLEHQSDIIQRLFSLDDPSTTISWLLTHAPKLRNTTIVLAGRQSQTLLSKFPNALADQGVFEDRPLSKLTTQEFRKLLSQHLSQHQLLSEEWLDESDRLWQLSQGVPAMLALILDLLTYGYLRKEQVSSGLTENNPGKLLHDFFSPLFDEDPILFYLGVARRGLTTETLRHLVPIYEISDCDEHLSLLTEREIVKKRQKKNLTEYYLHDVVYELFEQYGISQEDYKFWNNQLVEYYRIEGHKNTVYSDEWRQCILDMFYYELRSRPDYAFEHTYLELSEYAIKASQIGFDLQLRSELLAFLYLPDQVIQNFHTHLFDRMKAERENAMRWIKRCLAQANHKDARSISELLLSYCPGDLLHSMAIPTIDIELGENTEFLRNIFSSAKGDFWGHILVYYGESLAYTGTEHQLVQQTIEQGISLLEKLPEYTWLSQRVLGRAHNTIGYSLRSNGHYKRAIDYYHKALTYFSSVSGNQDEAADTWNNLAYVNSLLGNYTEAENAIEHAMLLRQTDPRSFPLALSYNTRGLIYALRDELKKGYGEARRAYNIFRSLDAPRGIGLAANALGYISRRQALVEYEQGNMEGAGEQFDLAENYLLIAVDIFSQQITEPIRLCEAYNELGCYYRDMGKVFNNRSSAEYAKSVESLEHSRRIALEYGLKFQEADTHDDLADVWSMRSNWSEAISHLQKCFDLVPSEFHFRAIEDNRMSPSQGEAYWMVLGKVHMQLGFMLMNYPEEIQKLCPKNLVQDGVENLVLATACFRRFWGDYFIGSKSLSKIRNTFELREIPTSVIMDVKAKYSLLPNDIAALIRILS